MKWPGLAALSQRSPSSGSRARANRFPVVEAIVILWWGVVADDNDDKLFTERAKDIRGDLSEGKSWQL